jgi:hypothetical protein
MKKFVYLTIVLSLTPIVFSQPVRPSSPPATRRAAYTGTSFTKRANEFIANHNRLSPQDRASILQESAKVDREIAAYVRKNNVSPEIEASLYAGEVKIGMIEDELKLMGNVEAATESASSKSVKFTVSTPEDATYILVTIEGGKVSFIDHTRHRYGQVIQVH